LSPEVGLEAREGCAASVVLRSADIGNFNNLRFSTFREKKKIVVSKIQIYQSPVGRTGCKFYCDGDPPKVRWKHKIDVERSSLCTEK